MFIFTIFALIKQGMNNQYNYSQHNPAIRYIKGRPVIVKCVEIKEIEHGPEAQPVYDIAHRAADDHGDSG